MTPPARTADWASRAVPVAMTEEKLAAFVDRVLDGVDGMLFTATPREELDEIGRWQQLKDQAFAGQVRAIVAAYNQAAGDVRAFSGDEVGLAIGATSTTGGMLVTLAIEVAELPGLLEAVEAGMLTERHIHAVLRELNKVSLTLEQRQAVALVMLARFAGHPPGELATLVKRLILTVDRAAAQRRQDLANTQRRVRFYGDVDGQAVLHARGPLAAIAAIKASLEATLSPATEAADERGTDEREFDLFVDLLTGGEVPGSWQAQVIVPFATAEGGELELAEVPGFGPILPSTAREILADCTNLVQVAVDEDGQVTSVSDPVPGPAHTAGQPAPVDATTQPAECPMATALKAMASVPALRGLSAPDYRPPPRLVRFVEARDRTCVFPGCQRPAAKSDKDHRTPWPLGGTDESNLQCLCRHHHRAKQAAFFVELTRDGDYRWTTRGGWRFLRRRRGY
jgi:hypothetical protein